MAWDSHDIINPGHDVFPVLLQVFALAGDMVHFIRSPFWVVLDDRCQSVQSSISPKQHQQTQRRPGNDKEAKRYKIDVFPFHGFDAPIANAAANSSWIVGAVSLRWPRAIYPAQWTSNPPRRCLIEQTSRHETGDKELFELFRNGDAVCRVNGSIVWN